MGFSKGEEEIEGKKKKMVFAFFALSLLSGKVVRELEKYAWKVCA